MDMDSYSETDQSKVNSISDTTADESIIGVKKKRAKRPISFSDSDSKSEPDKDDSDGNGSSETKDKLYESKFKKNYRKHHLTSDSNSDSEGETDKDEFKNSKPSESEDEYSKTELVKKTRSNQSSSSSNFDNESESEKDQSTKYETSDSNESLRSEKEEQLHKVKPKNASLVENKSSNSHNYKKRYSSDATLPIDSFSSLKQKSIDASDIIPETDDDDDDDDGDIDEKELSQIHCFSPRTRRSITGRRSIVPIANSDETDDDEILFPSHSDEHNSAEILKEDESSDGIELHGVTQKRNRSIANDSIMFNSYRSPNQKRFSFKSTSTPSRSTPEIEFSDKSDESKTSDIQINSSTSEYMKSITSDRSVVVLNSSDEENREPIKDESISLVSSTPGNIKYLQPKIEFIRNPMNSNIKYVSRAHYNQKTDELATLNADLKESKDLLQRLGFTLPDKGSKLQQKIAEMQRTIDKKNEELRSYAIEEDNLHAIQMLEEAKQSKPKHKFNSGWRDELEAIQPIHTGKQGMATFNTQKALTLNRIEKLHKAMEKCPTEADLAPQPSHLNVDLMPHQLYAIKWMSWREKQQPKGGLLADDMGLGKTLTVIGLVLATKYGNNNTMSDVESGSEEESNDEDDDVARGYKKKYKNKGNTLIICPASLINQWEREIVNRVKRRQLSVQMYHGNKRSNSISKLCQSDLVITTYGIISSDHKNTSALFRVHWERIVLDEAHLIRNHSTAIAKGCCDLRGTMRWGLTGTPIQNKHMDVYSMLKFLRVTPFDDLATFKKWIDPKTQAGMSRLHNILKPLLLRRTKTELQVKGELQELPNKQIVIEEIQLSPEEKLPYTKILTYSQTLFAQFMVQHQQRHGMGKVELDADMRRRLEQLKTFHRSTEVKSAQILLLLLRLRQICDHPCLIDQMLEDECDMEGYDDEECNGMERDIIKKMIGLQMNDDDVDDSESNRNNLSDIDDCPSNVLARSNKIYNSTYPSSKCKRAIQIVKRVLNETDDKVVVVSQWTTFLNILAALLHRERVHYVELTGKTPIKERNDIVVSFNNPNSRERVMMLSLVAGGVGLNLTGANHLILLDPHWNPQLESQAFDRVYRVGQTKDVTIYKLLCEKTIEKQIQAIQDKKLELSDNVLTGSKQNGGTKLSIQDMRTLFEM